MDPSEEGVAGACAGLILAAALLDEGEDDVPIQQRHRAVWSEEWLKKRRNLGSYYTLHREFRLQEKLFRKSLAASRTYHRPNFHTTLSQTGSRLH